MHRLEISGALFLVIDLDSMNVSGSHGHHSNYSMNQQGQSSTRCTYTLSWQYLNCLFSRLTKWWLRPSCHHCIQPALIMLYFKQHKQTVEKVLHVCMKRTIPVLNSSLRHLPVSGRTLIIHIHLAYLPLQPIYSCPLETCSIFDILVSYTYLASLFLCLFVSICWSVCLSSSCSLRSSMVKYLHSSFLSHIVIIYRSLAF